VLCNINHGEDEVSARRKLQFGFVIWSCGLLAVAMAMPGFSSESEAGQGWPGIQMDAGSIAIYPVTLSSKAMARLLSFPPRTASGRTANNLILSNISHF
jgi:hypothetical protein